MVTKEGTFEAKSLWMKRLTWVLCSFGNKLHPSVGRRARVMAFQEPRSLKVALVSWFSFLSFFLCTLLPANSPGLVYGRLLSDLPFRVSRDQTAVDAARSQSPLQSALLFFGGQDCDDGLVEHRLQALLRQCRAFHVATRPNLTRQERTVNT